jgi:RNA polymerase sigma factor (sigma-70 family)
VARVRGGDIQAYGELFDRHLDVARRLARQLTCGSGSDDLVSAAFAKVLAVLQSGRGPDVAVRAYLLAAVRLLHGDRQPAGQRVQPTGDVEQWDSPVPFQDSAVADSGRSDAARAFASLPERHQVVLWHLEVEEQKPAEVGVLLGLSPNAVSALGYRARENLRRAYLRMHLADTADDSCRWTIEYLGGDVRSGLSRRDAGKAKDHLAQCPRCAGLYEALAEGHEQLDEDDGNGEVR